MGEVPEYYLGKDGKPCWDATINWGLCYDGGSAWKYLVRAGKKDPDPRKDWNKAIAHIKHMIEVWEDQFQTDCEDKTYCRCGVCVP